MAKRGVLDHPKTLDLATRLHIDPPFALGLLEALWHWTAKYRPTGDVSGTSAELFAASIRYSGDAQELWTVLQATGWLDAQDDQLLVHDWSEHADDAIQKQLKRRGETFADGSAPYARKFWNCRDAVATTARQGHDVGVPPSRLPEPEPEPEPEPVNPAPAAPSPGDAFALAAMEPEPGLVFEIARSSVLDWWRVTNGTAMPWDGSEQRRLKEFLAANPQIGVTQFRVWLAARGASEVNLAERPRAWLATLSDYANGPLDRFKKPQNLPDRRAPVDVGKARNTGPPSAAAEADQVLHAGTLIFPLLRGCANADERIAVLFAPDSEYRWQNHREDLEPHLRRLMRDMRFESTSRKESAQPC